jgi:hypothetical protein
MSFQQHFLRVPYLARLENTFTPGQSLIVRGVATGKNFVVNLQGGPNVDGDNIALHVSWRQHEKTIVLNTFENGGWKKEERHGGGDSRGETVRSAHPRS